MEYSSLSITCRISHSFMLECFKMWTLINTLAQVLYSAPWRWQWIKNNAFACVSVRFEFFIRMCVCVYVIDDDPLLLYINAMPMRTFWIFIRSHHSPLTDTSAFAWRSFTHLFILKHHSCRCCSHKKMHNEIFLDKW